jgi:hypothetical protein
MMSRLGRHLGWGAAALCAVVTLGCDTGERAPAEPPFSGQPIDQAPRAAVLDYARAQRYVQVSGDSQRLMVGAFPDARYGPRAHIDPVSGGFKQGDSASLGRGRVLARVINVDTISYPKLNLGPQDTVYWYVDGSGGRLRSILISTRPDSRPLIKGLRRERHPENGKDFKWRQAEARFMWSDTDEQLWVACDVWDCCRTDEALQ